MLKPFEHPLRSTCSCSCEDLNKPTPQSDSRARIRRNKAGVSIEDLPCSTSHHLIAYNSLVNLLQDSLYSNTERKEVIYQNDVQTLLSSIVGKIPEPSCICFQFQTHLGIKFVGKRNYISSISVINLVVKRKVCPDTN